jgi:hypothetical protein
MSQSAVRPGRRLAERSDVLFDEIEAVREHERFFEEALSKSIATV